VFYFRHIHSYNTEFSIIIVLKNCNLFLELHIEVRLNEVCGLCSPSGIIKNLKTFHKRYLFPSSCESTANLSRCKMDKSHKPSDSERHTASSGLFIQVTVHNYKFVRKYSKKFRRMCSLRIRHVSVQTSSSIFTTSTRGQRRILMVQSILDTSNSSALMCGYCLLVAVW
jgi:hypothetical protein